MTCARRPPHVYIGLQPHSIWVVWSDGVEATTGRQPMAWQGPVTLYSTEGLRVCGRLLAEHGRHEFKALHVIRRELFVDRRRARQRSSRLLLRKGNVFKLLVPPS